MKGEKSQVAGALFGVAMSILLYMMLGTPGFVVLAPFTILGMQMFKGLDDEKPDDKNNCR
mgnify:CR=1 FL=1